MYDSTGDEMEKIVEQGMLYDFYGELLTPHQRKIYEDVVFNDMSLSEIAEKQGISRQGVHDLVKRCDKTLAEYESKLKLSEESGHEADSEDPADRRRDYRTVRHKQEDCDGF